ncbi:MAG: glycerol kinase GlpK, partial [Defluviitaleaceae bacterium]|nr:glycerol kinase GlpK [Defluviitaleaceae bacterium]
DVAAIGITNQRETAILWDRRTGEPVCNAIVWQCRRTHPYCEEIKKRGLEPYIKENTGLLADAYFSATKIMWMLDHVPGVRERAEAGEILFGTVDTWLLWKLSGGRAHATDRTNASRTMLFNIKTLEWDERLLNELNIPRAILPEVKSSAEIYTTAQILGCEIPVAGIAGDQQSALFGQQCFSKGETKNTYGTGCFLLMNTGGEPCFSKNGLITTVAASAGAKTKYALEGSVFMGGAILQWLRDGLGIINSASESEACAIRAKNNGGVYIVPAFAGLGAPHWDMYARGAVFGLTRGVNKDHIVRAALESIAYQTKDVLDAMQADTGVTLKELKADGGASANNFLMQFQADILNAEVVCTDTAEATATGAAYLAGLGAGMWKDANGLKPHAVRRRFVPSIESAAKETLLNKWAKAVERSLQWETQ